MATFTSSLPDDLLENLAKMAKELKMPKNKLIEKALRHYFEQIEKAQYAKSFKRAANDPEMFQVAEEGITDWFRILEELENE